MTSIIVFEKSNKITIARATSNRCENENNKYSHINMFRKYFNVIIETYNRSITSQQNDSVHRYNVKYETTK